MNISAPFILRPVGTTLLAIGLGLAGIIAFNFLPVSALPQIEFPTISVNAALPGASPEIMASSVATPLEKQLGNIAGVTEITSISTLGSTRITIQFDLTRNIDGAARDVQAAINAARSKLPIDLPATPSYRKMNPGDAPILILALTSDTLTKGQMYDVASTVLQQKLSQIDGVGQVIVGGSSLPAVRVELNPTSMSKYGITLENVRNIINNENANRPKGHLTQGSRRSEITSNDQIFTPKEYQDIIVRYNNPGVVRLSDIGNVQESVEDIRNAGVSNGKPSVILVIFKQPNANVITTVDNVQKILPFLKSAIPAAIDMTIMMDRTTTIRASLTDVEITLLVAIFLVIFVIYLFLGSARSALIPSIAIPLSLLGTFSIMYLCGFSLNNLSLMALTIATGFVVDDAVVVIENITRHIENGLSPFEAALKGVQEVGFTVMSMSFSLIAVFIPILLMSGIVGRLLREFAITMSIAILVSLVISLTLTPTMCAYFLKPTTSSPGHDKYFNYLLNHYRNSLHWALQRPNLMLSITFLVLIFNIYLYVIVPKGFFPIQDTGRIIGSIQAQQNSSFTAMNEKLNQYVNILMKDPGIDKVTGFVGGGTGNNTANGGSLYITLKPLSERGISSEALINRLRPELAKVPASNIYLRSAQDLVIGGRSSNAQFIYVLTAYDLPTLNTWTPRVVEKLMHIPELADVNSDQLNLGLQLYIKVDRDKAMRYGISSQQIDNTLYDAFGQRQVSNLYTIRNQYHVVMEVSPEFWQNPRSLDSIYVAASNGQLVPLSTFATYESSNTLLLVSHQSQFPAATISFNITPGVALGAAVQKIENAIAELNLPSGTLQGSFQGTAQAFQASLANEPYLILAALLAIYIILGMLYESLIHPITIISTLPSAGVGALLALLITHTELTIIAFIGIILLLGIVKKNAIMMIDFAQHLKNFEHYSPKDAIFEACLLRFRPIMMTTFAAMFSALPLAFGDGVGNELRRPLGIAIIGGLLLSQLLTLYTTPVIYLIFEKMKKKKVFLNERFA